MLNPFGKKLEPKSFMMQCPIDGIRNELPEGFPGIDKVIVSLTNFVQGIMNPVLAGGSPDPKSATEDDANGAYFRFMIYDYEDVFYYFNYKYYLRSVRCLQD